MNMSYCRFENTFNDLQDCLNALEELEKTSDREMSYMQKIADICEDYIKAHEDYKIMFGKGEEDHAT